MFRVSLKNFQAEGKEKLKEKIIRQVGRADGLCSDVFCKVEVNLTVHVLWRKVGRADGLFSDVFCKVEVKLTVHVL